MQISATVRPYLAYAAIVKQLIASDPIVVAKEFENSLGGTQLWTRQGTGNYILNGIGASDIDQIYIPPFGNLDDLGGPGLAILGINVTGITGWYYYYPVNEDAIALKTKDLSFVPIDLVDLLGPTGTLYLPEIRVYI